MSDFKVPVVAIRAIEPIEGADMIELAVVGEYRSVVSKNKHIVGEHIIYIPEGAVVPDVLIEKMGLTGKLAGGKKNRVKAVRLRGALSQGLILGFEDACVTGAENDNMAEALGIVKYEPQVPASMVGEVFNAVGCTPKYDIENFKWHATAIEIGEEVVMTEKVHGTFVCFSVVNGLNHPEAFGDSHDGLVMSKGLGAKGLVFKDNEKNASNIYVMMAKKLGIHARIKSVFPGKTVHLMGELYGGGVQDLTYGLAGSERDFAAFDISVDGRYLDDDEKELAFQRLEIARVPALYRGPFSWETMEEVTNGLTIVGHHKHIREGVVITPCKERCINGLGRVILKSVSADYLTRKGGTELA